MGIKKRYGIIAYGSFCGVWILMFLAFVFWAVSEFFPQEGSGWVLMKTGVWLAVPIAESATMMTAVFLMRQNNRKYNCFHRANKI